MSFQEKLINFRTLLEVTGTIKSFARESGKTEDEVEVLWSKAKEIAKDEGQAENYAYITGILKKMLKIG